jgi:rubredoxin
MCGYLHDEEKEGTPFDELPDDYVCPECGEGKEAFRKVDG